MHDIHPIRFFTRQLAEHEQFKKENLNWDSFKKISAWYSKLLLVEPFRIYERISRDSQIKEHQLKKPPIFILGHWRSGTSFLQSLLSRDPRRGFLHKYASVFPESFLCSENILKPLIRKITDSFETKKNISQISVSWEWETPGELDIAMITLFSPYSPHWGHVFPADEFDHYMNKFTYFNTTTQEEEAQWKKTCHHLINKVSIKNNNRQLIIKSPANTARIEQLLDLYPDAKFIYIHRNPYDVFYSNVKMWEVILNNLSFQRISREQMINNIFKTYKKLLNQYLQHRALIPENNLIEIRYEKLIKAPLNILETSYKTLSLEDFDNARSSFEDFLSSQMKSSGSKYNYTSNILERIETEWYFSLKEWPYESLHKSIAAE